MTVNMVLAMPTISEDGTSKEELVTRHVMCLATLRVARERLAKTMPLPRDYPHNYDRAHAQHCLRLTQIDTIIYDMAMIGANIADQIGDPSV